MHDTHEQPGVSVVRRAVTKSASSANGVSMRRALARVTRTTDDGNKDATPADGDTLINENGVEIVSKPTTIAHLKQTAQRTFGDLGPVKAVVDVERQVMAIGGGLHIDEQAALLNDGSRQRAVWGISLRPPANRSRSVQDPATQAQVIAVVRALVKR